MPKITELPPVGGVNAVDTLPLVQAGTTAKATFAQLPISTAVQTALDAKVNTSAVGTIASQNANSVAITGGSVTGIIDLAVADGGTGASTAAQARTNLGATSIGDTLFTAGTAATARTALGFTSPIINREYAEYTANAALSAIIPADDTIPQVTEGTQIISVSFTPSSTTSRLRLRYSGQVSTDAAAGMSVIAALFSNASSNALAARFIHTAGVNYCHELGLEYEYVPGTTSTLTFSIRVGPGAAANVRLNGNTTQRTFGGVSRATLVIEEIAA